MPTEARYGRHAEAKPVEMAPGVIRRTLVWGERAMVCEMTVPRGSGVPTHQDVHEQLTYVVSGRVEVTIDGVVTELGPGDACAIPSNAVHSGVVLEDAVLIDIFSPVREEYR